MCHKCMNKMLMIIKLQRIQLVCLLMQINCSNVPQAMVNWSLALRIGRCNGKTPDRNKLRFYFLFLFGLPTAWIREKLGRSNFFFWPTGSQKSARHKSTMLKINWLGSQNELSLISGFAYHWLELHFTEWKCTGIQRSKTFYNSIFLGCNRVPIWSQLMMHQVE